MSNLYKLEPSTTIINLDHVVIIDYKETIEDDGEASYAHLSITMTTGNVIKFAGKEAYDIYHQSIDNQTKEKEEEEIISRMVESAFSEISEKMKYYEEKQQYIKDL
jgi:multisubunit Na+/H+ antiporter MnhE subunit